MNAFVFASLVLGIFLATNIAAFARRGPTTFESFSADPNAFGVIAIALSMSGSIIGGGMFLVVGQLGFEAGKTGYFYGLALAVGFLVTAYLVPRIRHELTAAKSTTLIELIEKRFSARSARFFSLLNGLMSFFLAAGQFVGLAIVCNWLSGQMEPSYLPWVLAGLCAVSLSIYPIIGGARKDILTDIVQAGVVLVVVFYLGLSIALDDQAKAAIGARALSPDLTVPGYGLPFIVGGLIFMPWLYLVRLDVWQRIRAASSEQVARRAMIFSALVSVLAVFVFTSLGIWAHSIGLTVGNRASLEVVITHQSNVWLSSLVAAAFFGAVLTASDTYISITALFFSRVLFNQSWRKYVAGPDLVQGRNLVFRTRLVGLGAAGAALIFAYYQRNFIDLAVGAVSLLLMFIPLIAGLLNAGWRSERGSFYAPLLGFIVFLILFFSWQPKLAFVPSVICSLIIYAGFVWLELTKHRVTPANGRATGASGNTER